MTKIFVINLESSTERKENISRQLGELSLYFELFSAVDGRTSPPHPLLKRYNDDLSQTYRAKTLSAGQLGCYASHYLLWQKCAEINQPIIVIEDDALLYKEEFLNFIRDINDIPENVECVRLFNNKRRKFSSYSSLVLQDQILIKEHAHQCHGMILKVTELYYLSTGRH